MNEKKSVNKKQKSVLQQYILLAIAAIIWFVIKSLPAPEGLDAKAMGLLASIVCVVFLWVTEPIPHALSSICLPILLALAGVGKFVPIFKSTFGSNVFAFLMGILCLSAAFRRSGLSKRIASYFCMYVNRNAKVVLFGVMFLSFFISMWITDMAAVGIIIPVAISVLVVMGAEPGQSNFGKALTLGVSWGSVFGGMTTPAGVGSNITAMTLLGEAGIEVGFNQWMAIGFPIGFIGLIVGYFVLLLVFKPEIKEIPFDREAVKAELAKEPFTMAQKWVLVVFVLMIIAFLTSEQTGLNINMISFMVIPLLCAPGTGVFKSWKETEQTINWGAIFLAVAGVSVGSLAQETGLAGWIANTAFAPLAGMPAAAQFFSVAFLTDVIGLFLSSMTITASVALPIVIAFAQANGISVFGLAVAATMASSTVIVLVTQTPALILSYAEGYYTLKDCAKAGIIMTVLSAVIVAVVCTVCASMGMI